MRKRTPLAQKLRKLIEHGYSTKEIVAKLQVKPQTVYQMRYQINKAKGLGAIAPPAPVPTAGIGAPPKKPTRKVRAGTGINNPEPAYTVQTLDHQAVRDQFARPASKPGEILPVTMVEPPTLWQRIVRFFRG